MEPVIESIQNWLTDKEEKKKSWVIWKELSDKGKETSNEFKKAFNSLLQVQILSFFSLGIDFQLHTLMNTFMIGYKQDLISLWITQGMQAWCNYEEGNADLISNTHLLDSDRQSYFLKILFFSDNWNSKSAK